MKDNIAETVRVLDRYFPSDITDIVLEYMKKCLWDYHFHIPDYENANGFFSFDEFFPPSCSSGSSSDTPFLFHTFISIPVSFSWVSGDGSPFYPQKDCLILAEKNNSVWIPVTKDEHEKVYNYLKQWFEFL
jgi:hypothetical protein